MLPELQANIPDPLAEYLPELLPTGRTRNPAIRVLLLIFICKYGLKGASMQVEIKHISGSEGIWRDRREELLIEHSVAHRADGRWGGTGWMSGQEHADRGSCRRERNIRAIEECTAGP